MGKKIGKYEFNMNLGTGFISKTRRVTDTETNESWAIKIIAKNDVQRERMEAQLKREIAVLKLLKHRNIVQMKEVLQTERHIYIVLELACSGDLFDKILCTKRLDENTARKYFQQLICGIHHCHCQGVAHRDLKPEKIFFDKDGVLKISDFSLANYCAVRGGFDFEEEPVGTPNYVAPEVLRGPPDFDAALADVWACGVILFAMLAGFLPFDDANMQALFRKVERADYRIPSHFSPCVADLISRILVADPVRRITTEELINHPWFQVGFDSRGLCSSGSGDQIKVEEPIAHAQAPSNPEKREDTDTGGAQPEEAM